MKIDSTAAPTVKRISGTLHKRGYVDPTLPRVENLPRQQAEEIDVAGRRETDGHKDHERPVDLG